MPSPLVAWMSFTIITVAWFRVLIKPSKKLGKLCMNSPLHSSLCSPRRTFSWSSQEKKNGKDLGDSWSLDIQLSNSLYFLFVWALSFALVKDWCLGIIVRMPYGFWGFLRNSFFVFSFLFLMTSNGINTSFRFFLLGTWKNYFSATENPQEFLGFWTPGSSSNSITLMLGRMFPEKDIF